MHALLGQITDLNVPAWQAGQLVDYRCGSKRVDKLNLLCCHNKLKPVQPAELV